MPSFLIAYHAGRAIERPDVDAKHMAKWQAWVEGLGDAIVNPGTPLGDARIVSSEGVSDDVGPGRLIGYAIVKAESMEAAIEIAKTDPYLEMGTVELAEIVEM